VTLPKAPPPKKKILCRLWEYWKGLLPHKKWLAIGFVFAFPGMGMMRLSSNEELGFDSIGVYGLMITGIALVILIFVAVPLSIIDWRRGKTGFWHDSNHKSFVF